MGLQGSFVRCAENFDTISIPLKCRNGLIKVLEKCGAVYIVVFWLFWFIHAMK